MLPYPDIHPVALDLGFIAIRWYGLMYIFGFTAGWLLGRGRATAPHSPLTPQQWNDLLTWMVLALILGARIGYILFYDMEYFLANPLHMFMIWKGGMSFHGGLLGLAVCFWLFAGRTGRGVLSLGDFVVPLAPPGLFFGRMGNFINGELWGRATSSPLGMIFPDSAAGNIPRHPSQLYEALLEGALLFLILYTYSSKPRPRGEVSGLFLTLYGAFRFVVEFFRQPDPQLGFIAFGWLTMGQILCLGMIIPGLTLMILARRGAFADSLRPSGNS